MGDLTANFDREEFECKCGCGFNDIDLAFVKILQNIRNITGKPMRINSGCRCMTHNEEVDGVPHSAHMRGLAADVAVFDSEQRFRLVAAALESGIKRVGLGKTFVHLDIDDGLPTPRIWLY